MGPGFDDRVLLATDHDDRVVAVVGPLEKGSGLARLLARFEGLGWSGMDRSGSVFRRLPALFGRPGSARSWGSQFGFSGDRQCLVLIGEIGYWGLLGW